MTEIQNNHILIIVGSTSDRKIQAVRDIFLEFVDTQGVKVTGFAALSQVPETPYDVETYLGAQNRARYARQSDPGCDFSVGLESGLVERYGHLYEEAWAVITNRQGQEYAGYSSGLKVPDYIVAEMKKRNMRHSEFMTVLEQEMGNVPNDTWGTYTGGKILRTQSLVESVRNAVVQVLGPKESLFHKK